MQSISSTGIGVIAGNTVWSMPKRLESEVLRKVRYISTLTFTFYLYRLGWASGMASIWSLKTLLQQYKNPYTTYAITGHVLLQLPHINYDFNGHFIIYLP